MIKQVCKTIPCTGYVESTGKTLYTKGAVGTTAGEREQSPYTEFEYIMKTVDSEIRCMG